MWRRVLAAGMRKERRCFSARGSGGDDVVIGILTAGCAEETAELKRARPDLLCWTPWSLFSPFSHLSFFLFLSISSFLAAIFLDLLGFLVCLQVMVFGFFFLVLGKRARAHGGFVVMVIE